MLGGEYAGGKGLCGVVFFHDDGCLQNDRASVVAFIDEMYGAAGDFRAVVQHGLMGVEAVHPFAAKGGEEGGVDVHDPSGVSRHDGIGDFAHVASEADQVGPCFAERGKKGFGIGVFPGLRLDRPGDQAHLRRFGKGGRVGLIPDYDGNAPVDLA